MVTERLQFRRDSTLNPGVEEKIETISCILTGKRVYWGSDGKEGSEMLFRLLGSLIMGALVGWIAGKVMDSGGGLLHNIVVGVIGSFVGSFVFGLLGFAAYGVFANLVVSVVGACLFIWLGRKLFR